MSMNAPQQQNLRSAFKEGLSKLIEIDTRTQAFKQLQTLIIQNKTTNNLRIWLSVLSQNRKKHSQSQINVLNFIIQQYGKGLLDPLDKLPSLEKTVFRITQLVMKFFGEQFQNVAISCQRAWITLYQISMNEESTETKKKLLYDPLQAIINGGGGRIAQTTAQLIVDGLLQFSLAKEDHQFFKEIAKRTLILFLKTTVYHPSTLICLQTILGFFNIMNLLPLLQSIINKITSYVSSAQTNSIGYKMKGEACNCLGIIGEQIDKNGVTIFDKVVKLLSDMATDKVWAVQAPGRRALGIWKTNKKKWDQDFISKNEKVGEGKPEVNLNNLPENVSEYPYPKTYEDNWTKPPKQEKRKVETNPQGWNNQRQPQNPYLHQNYQNPQYLHKNTGMGGGNNLQSVQNYYERQKPSGTYNKKMQQIKKSLYNPRNEDIEYEDTVVWEEREKSKEKKKIKTLQKVSQNNDHQEDEDDEDLDFLDQWQYILELTEKGKYEDAVKLLLQLDDDLYFLRYFLKYSAKIHETLTRNTSNKVLKKMLQIKKTNFMEQMLFKMVAQSAKSGAGQMLSNSQNLQIINHLQNASKASGLKQTAQKLSQVYENSLQ